MESTHQQPTPSPTPKTNLLLVKYVAMVLFIILPFVGFYLGIQYQKAITPPPPPLSMVKTTSSPVPQSPIPTPSSALNTKNWQTFSNAWNISFQYPPEWKLVTDTFESGMMVNTADLQMSDFSHVQKGAFLYGPYVPGVLPDSWENIFDGRTNEQVDIVPGKFLVGGQEAKAAIITEPTSVEMLVYYKYPKPWKYSADTTVKWSFIDLVSAPAEFEHNKKIFMEMLSTWQFTQ